MEVSAKDKRIKALNAIDPNVADANLKVKGLRPADAALIRNAVAVLRAAGNLTQVATAHPEYRVHHHQPRKATSPWSIDVSGNWRLLFEYDRKAEKITGLRLADPH